MKKRLDVLVAERKNISRQKAQQLILSGNVLVDNIIVDKVGIQINEGSQIILKKPMPYVSRGALKLEGAYQKFHLNFRGKVVCDVGASTGGFTDFALKHGAQKVYAIDTGYGQIAQKLRGNKRVILLEKTNIKNVESLPEKIDFFLIDVSFISLKKVLPAVKKIISNFPENLKTSEIIALVKPQFEVGKKIADINKGVIKNTNLQIEILKNLKRFAKELGFFVLATCESPIIGAKGNKEFFLHLKLQT